IGRKINRQMFTHTASNDIALMGVLVTALPNPLPRISKPLPSIPNERKTEDGTTAIKNDESTISEGVRSAIDDYFAKQELVNEFQRANRGIKITYRHPASLPDIPYRYKRYTKEKLPAGGLDTKDKTTVHDTELKEKHITPTDSYTTLETSNPTGIISSSIKPNPILDLSSERLDIENSQSFNKSDFNLILDNSNLDMIESNSKNNIESNIVELENIDTTSINKMETESANKIPKLTVSLTPLKIAEDSITQNNDTLAQVETDKPPRPSRLTLSPISTRRANKMVSTVDFIKTDQLKLPQMDIQTPRSIKGTFNLRASTSSESSFQDLVHEDMTNVATPFRPASDPGRTLPPLNFQSTLREDDHKMVQGDKDWFKVLSDQELTEKITLKMCEDPVSYDTFANTRISPRGADVSKHRDETTDITNTVQSNVGFIRTKKGNKRPKKGVFPIFDQNPNGPLQRVGEKTRKRQKKKSA
ncbi:unnamed protein product, partial [Owenia fusiformis]